MAQEKEEIEGSVKSVVFHNDGNGWTVLHVEPSQARSSVVSAKEITIVGKVEAVWEGEDVKAVGSWVVDKTHGRQFKADSIT